MNMLSMAEKVELQKHTESAGALCVKYLFSFTFTIFRWCSTFLCSFLLFFFLPLSTFASLCSRFLLITNQRQGHICVIMPRAVASNDASQNTCIICNIVKINNLNSAGITLGHQMRQTESPTNIDTNVFPKCPVMSSYESKIMVLQHGD